MFSKKAKKDDEIFTVDLTLYTESNHEDFVIFCGFLKGQLISKKIVKPRILPKNERMNSFLLVCDVFSFVFWKNPRTEKNISRLSDL